MNTALIKGIQTKITFYFETSQIRIQVYQLHQFNIANLISEEHHLY